MKRWVLILLVFLVAFASFIIKENVIAVSTDCWSGNVQLLDISKGIQASDILAAGAKCTNWSKQLDGCYERVCCCDKNGQMWCERCCPNSNGDCTEYRVKCN